MPIFAIEINNKVFLREFESAEALREHLKNLCDEYWDESTVIRPATQKEIARYLNPDYED